MQKTSVPSLQQVSSAQETPPTNQRTKKYDLPHMIIPDADMAWALEQRSPVCKLWGECWRSDPYGSRWMPLKTSLGKENLKKAKKPLIDADFFLFENRLTIIDGKRSYEWWIKNLHGCRSSYWKLKGVDIDAEATVDNNEDNTRTNNTEIGILDTEVGTHSTTQNQGETGSTEVGTNSTEVGTNSTEVGIDNTVPPYLKSLAERVSKALINSSVTSHKHFTLSLLVREREEFLNFCLQKIKAIQSPSFKVHTDDGWIAKHYEQYWNEFCEHHHPEAVEIAQNVKWTNHPHRDEWIAEIERSGNPLLFAARDKEKQEFVKWANDNKIFSWHQEDVHG
ncbi:MAG: hypothetical protein PUP91_06930 [Rhizonema sp. PD37]|nr:hypothetical protein [Rhizonema sp. PD37]